MGGNREMKKRVLRVFLALILTISYASAVMAISEGSVLSDFVAKDLQGKDVKISSFKGGYVLYHVWNNLGGPIRVSLSAFRDNRDKLAQLGVKCVTIAANSQQDEVAKMARTVGIPYTVLYDPNENLQTLWRVFAYPSMILVDPAGKVIWTDKGFSNFTSIYRQINFSMGDQAKKQSFTLPKLKPGQYQTQVYQIDYDKLAQTLHVDFLADNRVNFEKDPQVKPLTEPKYPTRPMYSTLHIGNTEYLIAALDTQRDGVLDTYYVDSNGNLDLTDDGAPLKLKVFSNYSETTFPITVKSATGDVTVKAYTYSWELENMVGFETVTTYQTQIATAGKPMRVLLVDANCNTLFGDPDDVILLDLDGNGRFNSLGAESGLVECWRLDTPVQLGDAVYTFEVLDGGKIINVSKVN